MFVRVRTSSTMRRAIQLCCVRLSPAVQGRPRVCELDTATTIIPSLSFPARKLQSVRCRNICAPTASSDFLNFGSLLSRAPCSLYSLASRAYYAGRESSNERTGLEVQLGYDQYGQQDKDKFPRPPTIRWDRDLVNNVELVGVVGEDVDLKCLEIGKVVASTFIVVPSTTKHTENPSWFKLEFWDSLAKIAAHHMKKGEQISVSGQIYVHKCVEDGLQQVVTKVVVSNLYFVAANTGSSGADDHVNVHQSARYRQKNYSFLAPCLDSNGSDGQSDVQSDQYMERKPDKCSRRLVATGISRQNLTEQRVIKQSLQGTTGQGGSLNDQVTSPTTEDRWREHLADPTQQSHNQVNKKSPKLPDFKHRITQEALWVDNYRTPAWVQNQMVVRGKQKQDMAEIGDLCLPPPTKKPTFL